MEIKEGEIHHCGNELTAKEIEFDHCLKCGEYIHEDEHEGAGECPECVGPCTCDDLVDDDDDTDYLHDAQYL